MTLTADTKLPFTGAEGGDCTHRGIHLVRCSLRAAVSDKRFTQPSSLSRDGTAVACISEVHSVFFVLIHMHTI